MSRVGVVAGCAAIALAAASVATATATSTATSPTTSTAPDANGAELFHSKGCASCHSGPDSTARFEVAPSLAAASSWAADRKPGVSAVDYLAESMLAPATFISPAFRGDAGPMTAMPELQLSPEEVAALVDYLLHP